MDFIRKLKNKISGGGSRLDPATAFKLKLQNAEFNKQVKAACKKRREYGTIQKERKE